MIRRRRRSASGVRHAPAACAAATLANVMKARGVGHQLFSRRNCRPEWRIRYPRRVNWFDCVKANAVRRSIVFFVNLPVSQGARGETIRAIGG